MWGRPANAVVRVKTSSRTFKSHTRGSVAVEFAMIALPLVMLICGCLELAMVILLSVTLDNATDVVSRDIRTGIITQGNTTATAFRQKICDKMGWLSNSCMSSLSIDVQTYATFADVPKTDLIQNGQYQTFTFSIGTGSNIQMVRAYYEWPLITPFLKAGMSKMTNGDAVITSKVIFRNEPF